MNSKHILAAFAIAFAASGAVQAQEIVAETGPTAVSLKSRAQVQAELAQARADGTLAGVGELPAAERTLFISTRTRAQVRDEVIAAMHSGDWHAELSERGGSYVTLAAPAATRVAGK